MKRLLLILFTVAAVPNVGFSQTAYQYAQDSVIQTLAGSIYIIRAGGAYIHYAKAEPAYERFEPATSSNPAITRNDEGFWEIDYSQFVKPAKSVVENMVRDSFNQYMTTLKSANNGDAQIWITIRTDSQGVFKNADVKIWAEKSAYSRIPPSQLDQLLVRLGILQFTVPTEYQCISDHYFRYSVFFKDL